MTTPRITTLEPTYATGNWNDLFIGVWRGPMTVNDVRVWGAEHMRMAAAHPRGFASFVLVEKQVPLPEHEIRRALARGMDQAGSSIRAMAGVQEARGFAAAVFHSLQTALSSLATSTYPRKPFASIPDAASWIAMYLGSTPTDVSGPAVTEVVETFREMIAAPGATPEPLPWPRITRG